MVEDELPKEQLQEHNIPNIDMEPSETSRRSKRLRKENVQYPSVFVFSETLLSKEVIVYNSQKQKTLTPEDGEYQITLRFIKVIRSEQHKKSFAWSLFWPSDRARIKLQRPILSKEDEDKSFESFGHALRPGDKPEKMKYQCYLCHQWHLLDMYATPTIDVRPSDWDA